MGVSVFALGGDAASVGGGGGGGRASLAALLPHSPCFLLGWNRTCSSTSCHHLLRVFADTAGSLSFALLTRLGHGAL